ncbi:MAG: hypothetical protein ABSD98_01095 [Candidatus Korobacteraceae bacterium]|jgi:hypothetical protein
MTSTTGKVLFWAPRLLCIAYIVFLGLFALDVFSEFHGFWRVTAALLIHLIPSFIVALVLALAWKWEWIGAVLFCAAATYYAYIAYRHPNWVLTISGPLFVVAALFCANWLSRSRTGKWSG